MHTGNSYVGDRVTLLPSSSATQAASSATKSRGSGAQDAYLSFALHSDWSDFSVENRSDAAVGAVRENLLDGCRFLFIHSCRESVLAGIVERLQDGGDLLRTFGLAEDHFRKTGPVFFGQDPR